MDDPGGEDAHRRGSTSRSRENGTNGMNGYAPTDGSGSVPHTPRLYRLDSNQSSTSIFEDVEMAHDEVGGSTQRSIPQL